MSRKLQQHPIQKTGEPDIQDLHGFSSLTTVSIDAYADADQTRAEQKPPETLRQDL